MTLTIQVPAAIYGTRRPPGDLAGLAPLAWGPFIVEVDYPGATGPILDAGTQLEILFDEDRALWYARYFTDRDHRLTIAAQDDNPDDAIDLTDDGEILLVGTSGVTWVVRAVREADAAAIGFSVPEGFATLTEALQANAGLTEPIVKSPVPPIVPPQ
jgi:hypothetical protein